MKKITTKMVLKHDPCWVQDNFQEGVKRINKILGKDGKTLLQIIRMKSIDVDDRMWLLERNGMCSEFNLKFLYYIMFQHAVEELEEISLEEDYFLNFVSQEIIAFLMKNTKRSRINYLREIILDEVSYDYRYYHCYENDYNVYDYDAIQKIKSLRIFIYNFMDHFANNDLNRIRRVHIFDEAFDFFSKDDIEECLKKFCSFLELYRK